MGPCRVTEKAPRGVCGADADLIVARNLLRATAAGTAQHGARARETILALKWAAQGKNDLPILGLQKALATAKAFGIETEGRALNDVVVDLADALLDDLSRTEPSDFKTIAACAPPERRQVSETLDIIPISAYHEVFEALRQTDRGVDGDWESVMRQYLRCRLAFAFSGVVGANIATDCLFGVGDRAASKVNLGALEKGYVNIAAHGRLPLLVSQIVEVGRSEEMVALVRSKGAKGI